MIPTNTLDYPQAVSRAEWLQARTALLAEERELTQARDRLSRKRREFEPGGVGR